MENLLCSSTSCFFFYAAVSISLLPALSVSLCFWLLPILLLAFLYMIVTVTVVSHVTNPKAKVVGLWVAPPYFHARPAFVYPSVPMFVSLPPPYWNCRLGATWWQMSKGKPWGWGVGLSADTLHPSLWLKDWLTVGTGPPCHTSRIFLCAPTLALFFYPYQQIPCFGNWILRW